jgi:hypothetical protein
MWNKLLVALVAAFINTPFSFAEEVAPTPAFYYQTQLPLPFEEASELVLKYNSLQFESTSLDHYSKEELIQLIRENSRPVFEKDKKRTEFLIPFGPQANWSLENDDLSVKPEDKSRFGLINDIRLYRREFSKESVLNLNRGLENLSEQDLRVFLSKKHAFLTAFGESLEKTFIKIRMKPPYKLIQGVLNTLNNIFFQKSEQFVHSNTFGIPIFVSTGLGATFGRILYDSIIAKTPLKKYIKPDFGFYVAAAFGIGVARIQQAAWVLDFYYDFETLKRAFAPIFEGNVGAGSGFYMETRSLPPPGTRFYTSSGAYEKAIHAPLIGTTKTGRSALANTRGFSAALPFPSTFFETDNTTRYLHIVLKKSYKEQQSPKSDHKSWWKKASQKYACLQVYSSSH